MGLLSGSRKLKPFGKPRRGLMFIAQVLSFYLEAPEERHADVAPDGARGQINIRAINMPPLRGSPTTGY
jgi:hypothetical protein